MAKKNVNTNLVIVLLVLIGLVGYALLVQAGNLEPPAAPAPTMKTLQEVYDAASGGINEREGFCQYFETPADSNEVVLTVPAGKRFVLLKLYSNCSDGSSSMWYLTVNENLLINGIIVNVENGTDNSMHSFPDRCVVVNAGETLKIVYTHDNPSYPLYTTIIGYYYDVP